MYDVEPETIMKDYVETIASFICLKVEKPGQFPKSVPDKTLTIIAIRQLNSINSMFMKVDLGSGKDLILSSDEIQVFNEGEKGGGLGILLRIKFNSRDKRKHPEEIFFDIQMS